MVKTIFGTEVYPELTPMAISDPVYYKRYQTVKEVDMTSLEKEEVNKLADRLDKALDNALHPLSKLNKIKHDMINNPPHYALYKYAPVDVLDDWFGEKSKCPSPLAWQIGKYLARHKHKGKPEEDLKKARFYLDRLIKQYEDEKQP